MGRPLPRIERIYQALSQNDRFLNAALRLRSAYLSKNTAKFLKERENFINNLNENLGVYQRDLQAALANKVVGKAEVKEDGFGISHFIDKGRYEDMDYRIAEIYIEPGATQPEVIAYIQKHWKTIDKELKAGLEKGDFAKRRLRKKIYTTRDSKILNLYKQGLTDKEIAQKMAMPGEMILVRRIISNMKKEEKKNSL